MIDRAIATLGLCAVLLLGACSTDRPDDEADADVATDSSAGDVATFDAADAADTEIDPEEDSGGLDVDPPDLDPLVDVPEDADVAPWGIETRPANPTCLATDRPRNEVAIRSEPALTNLFYTLPVGLHQTPTGSDDWYVVEKLGVVYRTPNRASATFDDESVFIDITDIVAGDASESGLLGMAFHPNYASNGYVYLSFNTYAAGFYRSRVSRFTANAARTELLRQSEQVLFDFEQPDGNHNGGDLEFGPDGYLYIAFGDGGSANDAFGHGQDSFSLFSTILRVDVDRSVGAQNYAVPSDNPFVGGGGAPEVWAFGLRNPWRMTFDSLTGELWAGDVGQNEWEEVDIIIPGANYGWPVFEGTHCFLEDPRCGTLDHTPPVAEYSHEEGRSITGGYVYRGNAIEGLIGHYVFADYVAGTIWALFPDGAGGYERRVILESGRTISTFAEDRNGELWFTDYLTGTLHQLLPDDDVGTGPSDFPELLSQTGCMDPNAPSRPLEMLIPYRPNAPFWSDGAEKERWFAIPDGTTIGLDSIGDFDFPIGSVIVKQFRFGGRVIETRLMMRHDDGAWAGYSYRWNDAGTDAEYVRGRQTVDLGGQTWLYPSGADCLACHTEAAGRTLGLEVAQLDRTQLYAGGVVANQLETYAHIGMLDAPIPNVAPLSSPYDATASLEERSRAYLHTNCSFCHQPDGPGRADIDLRWNAPDDGMCNAVPRDSLGIPGARVIAGNNPNLSILMTRTESRGESAMPPLGSDVADPVGVALLRQWIQAGACDEGSVRDEICGNGIDDDEDGATDCADPDCASSLDCRVDCSSAPFIGPGDVLNGSTESSSRLSGGSCGGGGGPEVVFEFESFADSIYCAESLGSDFDTVMYVRTSCADPGSELACNDDSAGTAQSQVEFFAEAGSRNYIFVDGESFGSYSVTMYVGPCD